MIFKRKTLTGRYLKILGNQPVTKGKNHALILSFLHEMYHWEPTR